MYCERCNRLADREKCPGCGRKDLRMPRYDDFCFLAEPDALWVQALTDLLQDNGVEFRTRNVQEAYLMAKTGAPPPGALLCPLPGLPEGKGTERRLLPGGF